jgi:alpha-amylase
MAIQSRLRVVCAMMPVTLALTLVVLKPTCARADVILQYFEGRYETIERRIPDIFMAGYDALWLPPTGLADSDRTRSQPASVGYDVFDRFGLGTTSKPTLYGTESQLRRLVRETHKTKILIYADIVLNHNGFSNQATPGFVQAGDYPGFALTLADDVDGDFHGASEAGRLNERINGGLVDIAQEKNHRFIRHPVDSADPRNIANEPVQQSNRGFYPDTDLQSPPDLGNTRGDRHTPSGFNLDHSLAGDPVDENATALLVRYCKWMVEVVGIDGFRLDAAKHIPTFFWNDFYDPAVRGIGPGGSTPYSFGEVIEEHDLDLLRSYTRKDGFGNRDILDFPLYFKMRDLFNAHGFGDMQMLEHASVDRADGNSIDGSLGVMFVSNHDELAPPPAKDNIAYAHILTRSGYPIVYFNALEFGEGRNFPRRGRGDALGGEFGKIITTLLDIHHEYARGPQITRLADNDVYIYERDQALIVGLNDNEAFDADRTIPTSFPGGTTLRELTGNPRATSPLVVAADGTANLKIPHNGDGRGYAMWGPQAPRGSTAVDPFVLTPVASVVAPDGTEAANGVRRITPIEQVTVNTVTLTLTLEDENLDDNALVRIDDGSVNLAGTPILGNGQFAGFQRFSTADPGVTGSGAYSATLDVSNLSEGLHYIEAIAFLKRDAWQPPIFETFRKVILVDR